jgi:hypothetical protein
MKQDPAYYAIIPADVRYSDIPPNAKLLYGEITALCNKEGYCWASNRYFADLYKVKPASVSEWVRILREKGFIDYTIDNENSRRIFLIGVSENTDRGIGKKRGGVSEKAEHNNTVNITKSNTLITTEQSPVNKSQKLQVIDIELTNHLLTRILENTPTFKHPNIAKWAEQVRLMRERDGRTEQQILYLIDWSQNSEFWKANILSTRKLREKFDVLVAQAKRDHLIIQSKKSVVI